MQKQCERFKKDRDTFKQLLESAQKKIGDLKSSGTGRVSRNSIHSSDNDDDRNKIHYLEQQVIHKCYYLKYILYLIYSILDWTT